MIENGTCQVHNVKFYNLAPRAIFYLSYNYNSSKMALVRKDASIEIWDMRNAPVLEKSILGAPNSSVEAVAWSEDRLFSAGTSGEITEWNLQTLEPKQTLMVTGSAVWCLDVNKENTAIAIGTEGGYLNVYSILNDKMEYEKFLDKQEGRILCCKYDHSGKFLVTGSIDSIRIWNVATGHAIHKMSTGRTEKNKETIVWTLHVLSDFQIISGDSRGKLTFWDGKIGAQIESAQPSKSDIFTIAVNDKEDTLFCSGADPTVRAYSYTAIRKDNQTNYKWVKAINKTFHHTDVKAMICVQNRLISCGIDGYIIMSSQSLKTLAKYGPFLQKPFTGLSDEKRLILLKYFNYLEIWKLGKSCGKLETNYEEEDGKKNLAMIESPAKLLELRSKKDEPIVSTSISPDGNWLIYSTNSTIRLYRFEVITGPPILTQIKILPEEFTVSSHIVFSPDSKTIFLAKRSGVIDVFELSEDGDVIFTQSIKTKKFISDSVHILITSPCGQYMVCSGLCNNISIWKFVIKEGKSVGSWQHHTKLPKYKIPPTSIAIRPNSSILAAVFPDHKIFEYDFEELQFTFTSVIKSYHLESTQSINNITFDPRNDDILLLHNDTNVCVLKKSNKQSNDKVQKLDGDGVSNICHVKVVNKYKHLVHLNWMSTNEMVAVEVNPVTLIEQLPPALQKKVYGTL